MGIIQEQRDAIRPETQALEAYIQATVHKILSAGKAAESQGLLFLGNPHDAMPRWIFQDPVLQPVDTRIWGVIKIAASSGPTAFPTYKQIAGLANVGSETTVARSMAILRATRWLTLCRRVRDHLGKHRGNVYALHDEPLPLGDALYLDQDYMQFLEQARTHGHAQVCKVATAVLASIAEDLEAGDMDTADKTLQRRVAAAHAAERDGHRYFAFSSRQLQILKSVLSIEPPQNLQSAPLQKLESACSSSSYISKKTTTTTKDTAIPPARAREDASSELLDLPAWLSPNERHLTRLCLSKAPAADHEDILDEFSGRILSAKRKSRPIDNPIGYLAKLCKAAGAGKFTLTSLGLKAREQRHRGNRGDGRTITPSVSPADGRTITSNVSPTDGRTITSNVPPTDGRTITSSVSPADGRTITSDMPPTDGRTITPDVPPNDGRTITSNVPPADGRTITSNVPPADGRTITSNVPTTDGRTITSDMPPTDGRTITPTPGARSAITARPGEACRKRALQDMRRILGVGAKANAPPSSAATPAGDGCTITPGTGPPVGQQRVQG